MIVEKEGMRLECIPSVYGNEKDSVINNSLAKQSSTGNIHQRHHSETASATRESFASDC